MQKRAIAVHDLSCVGRCSLTVALPILSAAGLNTAAVPTALLSTHTGEFTGYTHLDLSDQLPPITRHLATLGLHYDAFYSGYLASAAQADAVLSMMDALCDEKTHIFVDPAFGDFGRLYSLMEDDMPAQMGRLCSRARTIVPNLTEAAFLLGDPSLCREPSGDTVAQICRRLCAMGPENVVVTDISFQPGQTGAAVFTRGMERPVYRFHQRFDRLFHGTGDVFASLLLGGLMNGLPLLPATELALDMTHQAICLTVESGEALRYGIQFEPVLPRYWQRLNLSFQN